MALLNPQDLYPSAEQDSYRRNYSLENNEETPEGERSNLVNNWYTPTSD
jgi:hypothetical protein